MGWVSCDQWEKAKPSARKVSYFCHSEPSEESLLVFAQNKERFFASLRMTTQRSLSAFRPRRQVQLLLRRELVHLHTHRIELEPGDLAVDGFGHNVHLRLEFRRVFQH